MTFTPIGAGQAQAHRIGLSLRLRYSHWTVDREPNTTPIPYLRWTDEGARAAYQLICLLNRIPIEA